MLNIRIMGKYTDEKQVIEGKTLICGAVQFKEGKNVMGALGLGFLLCVPIILPMIVVSVKRCREINVHLDMNAGFAVATIMMIVLAWGLTYVHEFIHAAMYPRESVKTIWIDTRQGVYFVYCDALITRCRYVVLSLAPSVILGFIPFMIWYVIAPNLNGEWNISIMVLTWMMVVMSIGDYTNVFNTIRQVPKEASVFNYGMHSYWVR